MNGCVGVNNLVCVVFIIVGYCIFDVEGLIVGFFVNFYVIFFLFVDWFCVMELGYFIEVFGKYFISN